jgi:hypothetical protein
LVAVFEREMRGKGEESEGKWGASSRAVGVPGGVGEKDDVGVGFSTRWFLVEEETDGEDDADRWGPPVSGKKIKGTGSGRISRAGLARLVRFFFLLFFLSF